MEGTTATPGSPREGEIFRCMVNEHHLATIRRTGYYSGTLEVFDQSRNGEHVMTWSIFLPRHMILGGKEDDDWEPRLLQEIRDRLNRSKAP